MIQAAAAILSTSSGKGLLDNLFRMVILEACSATFQSCGSLNCLIPLDHCPHLVFLYSQGSRSAAAAARFGWQLRGLEWNVTSIKALSIELSLCWELTGPDAASDRGLSCNGDDGRRPTRVSWLLSVRSALVVFE